MAFTPVENRMMTILGDGYTHSPQELWVCLQDELAPQSNIKFHISNMRKKLRDGGMDVLTSRISGRTYYSLVRLLFPSVE